jgi:hypothetical protein
MRDERLILEQHKQLHCRFLRRLSAAELHQPAECTV